MNGAIWFGAAVFMFLGAFPALTSSTESQQLLGPKFHPYFSVALAQVVGNRFYNFYIVCSVVALLHLLAEWLYFGKYPSRLWLSLLFGLCLAGLVQAFWVQPELAQWHKIEFTEPARRETAAHAYATWRRIFNGVNVTVICGLGVYLWRVGGVPARRN
jgi:branched-subunit amino acid ABC-type transport system permease component